MKRIVDVRIETVRPDGVTVEILGDNRSGYVPRRELSWNRSVLAPPLNLKTGDLHKAVMLSGHRRARMEYLSLRQVTDPWEEAVAAYAEGQTVCGEVVNVRRVGIFIQLQPGIEAVAWNRDLPLTSDQLADEFLAPGDQVAGVVVALDRGARRMEVSLTRCLVEFNTTAAERQGRQQELVAAARQHPLAAEGASRASPAAGGSVTRILRPGLHNLRSILIVDDSDKDRAEIAEALASALAGDLAVTIDSVGSGAEALELLAGGRSYDLAVVDIRLGEESGIEVAQEIQNLLPAIAFVFASSDPNAIRDLRAVGGRRHPFAFKRTPEVVDWVESTISGYYEEIGPESDAPVVKSGRFIAQLGMTAVTRRQLSSVLAELLDQLREEAKVSYAIVVDVDIDNQAVAIVASSPRLPEADCKRIQDGLYFSPVRQVVEYAAPFASQRLRGYRNFFRSLAFRSCFGLPLTIRDVVTHHALFLLDQQPSPISDNARFSASLAAPYIQVALERSMMLDYMQRYERRYAQGQLLGSLAHELKVKLDAIDKQTQRLETIIKRLEVANSPTMRSEEAKGALDATRKVHQAGQNAAALIDAYSRLVIRNFEAVDVNAVVAKVHLQLGMRARELGVIIRIQSQSDLPPALAVQASLEQIITNIVLNAIQQTAQNAEVLTGWAAKTGAAQSLSPIKLITISTCYEPEDKECPIKVFVVDTGPGIQFSKQERIFALDTSTREQGHGLGLFISRSLAETMAGRVRLLASIMYVGSVFSVELPVYAPKETTNAN